MSFGTPMRLIAVLSMVVLFGGSRAVGAQEGGGADNEFGVGLYLGNCDSLVGGAALYDLGDAELETEQFQNADENTQEGEGQDTNLEDQLDEETEDATDVEQAVEGGDDEGDSDREVVVPGDAPDVYVSLDAPFGANLVDLVDAPFAVAIRESAEDEAETGEDEANFVACGEFVGAVAGNQIVIPLDTLNESEFRGIAILERGESEDESSASIYLFGPQGQGQGQGENQGENQGEDEGQAQGEDNAEGEFATPTD
ncbi:MAG: hypothetical protein M3Q03_20555 [Chloroflexota bacterium]|nr:hypothetical protein [Chloroflexota bacterium]